MIDSAKPAPGGIWTVVAGSIAVAGVVGLATGSLIAAVVAGVVTFFGICWWFEYLATPGR
ncbi:MAG TPA: hypothetical protein PK609_02860 [Candidatus Paceibacterota bacterium]|nr:hypothetical protein [Candidatus Paceibacterota bacterium]